LRTTNVARRALSSLGELALLALGHQRMAAGARSRAALSSATTAIIAS
jgi:hypothetical protein